MSEMRRHKIENAALRLFAERSIAEVSVRDIAQAAGIGESGLYRHMTSKEELAARVFTEAYRDFAHELTDALPEEGGFAAELEALVMTALTAFDRDPILFRFLVLRQHDNISLISDSDLNPVEVVRGRIVRAMERGEMPDMNPDFATATLMGIVLQPLTFALYGRIEGPARNLAHPIICTARRALYIDHLPLGPGVASGEIA